MNQHVIDYKLKKWLMRSLSDVSTIDAYISEDIFYIHNLGFDLDTILPDGETLLFKSVMRRSTQILNYLLHLGANPNIKTEDGAPPLTFAVWMGHIEAVEVLLSYGADPNIVDCDGGTPIQMASEKGRYQILKMLTTKALERLNGSA